MNRSSIAGKDGGAGTTGTKLLRGRGGWFVVVAGKTNNDGETSNAAKHICCLSTDCRFNDCRPGSFYGMKRVIEKKRDEGEAGGCRG